VVALRTHARLVEVAEAAHVAEARGDDAAASEEWRRYRLIRDALRDPDEILVEGIALSERAIELASSAGRSG
jgi:negative regulator of sigma E activity